MNHSEEADNPVPKSVSNLVVHIVDTHADHFGYVVTKLEIELDSVEVDLDKGGFSLKKQLLDDRRFPKMHIDLQRLLQVIYTWRTSVSKSEGKMFHEGLVCK